MKGRKSVVADIAECAVFVALMVAAAYIRIPFPLVPLTFQTAVSVLAGLLLGWKKGVLSMTVYTLAGLIGLPVFSEGGGVYYVFKPSFGYIVGFIAAAGVGGAVARGSSSFVRALIAAFSALAANYLIGIPYCIVAAHLSGVENLTRLFIFGNLIYLPKDAVLCVVAAIVAGKVAPALKRLSARGN